MHMFELLIICSSIVLIVGISEIGNRNYKLRLKKIQEDSKTANLALVYQILNTRPDLSLEDLKYYIESSENKRNSIDEKEN